MTDNRRNEVAKDGVPDLSSREHRARDEPFA